MNNKVSKPLNIANILKCTIQDFLLGSDKEMKSLPTEIRNFKFLETIRQTPSYALGIYDNGLVKVICKYWSGKRKDIFYYTLLNEIHLYKMFNNTTSTNVKFPDYIDSIENENELFLFIERISTEIIPEDSTTKVNIYFDAINFLDNAGKEFENSPESKNINKRDAKSYIVLSVPLLIKTLINWPQAFTTILSAYAKFIKYIPSLLTTNYRSLVHKDLNFNNILKGNDMLYIIDLQYLVWSSRLMDYAATTRFYISDEDFIHELTERLKNKLSNNDFNAYKAFCIYYCLMGLSDKNFTKKRIDEFFMLLRKIK